MIAGGPGDFAVVRHLRLSGSHAAIGRALAELARERHGVVPRPSGDPLRVRAQREYFRKNAPSFVERMRGAALAFGLSPDDDTHALAGLLFGFKPGCTVIYYPPSSTSFEGGVVSRNFDFTTGTFEGRIPGRDEIAVVSSPYVLELHPDEGYATLSVCAYDLLGGVVDGMNSEGLTIALLADDEVTARFDVRPAEGPQSGFDVLEIGRHVLETCADVGQAKAALLEAKLYWTAIPCHYLIADRHGGSFVWENSPSLTQGYIIDGEGRPQVTTNFMLHLHPESDLPEESEPLGSFNRFRTAESRIAEHKQPFDLDFVRQTSACVAATAASPPAPWAPGRTLWHALYFPEQRRLEIDFYLGEERGAIRRSGYHEFTLATPGREH